MFKKKIIMKKDLLDGDHSFKKWFQIMWSNYYIFAFMVGLAMMGYIIYRKSEFGTGGFCVAMSIPILICSAVGYIGFYRFWKKLKGE